MMNGTTTTTSRSGQGNLNVTAHARLITHMLSRTWKPAGWRLAVNLSKFTRIITPPPPQIHFPERNFISIAYSTFDVFVLVFLYYKHQKIDWYRCSWTSTSELQWNFVFCVFQLLAKQKGLQVKKMLNHNLNSRIFPPWTTFSTQSFHGKVCCCRLFRRRCLRSLLWQWFCPNFQANSLYKSKDT